MSTMPTTCNTSLPNMSFITWKELRLVPYQKSPVWLFSPVSSLKQPEVRTGVRMFAVCPDVTIRLG